MNIIRQMYLHNRPVNDGFSEAQREIYSAVLQAEEKAIQSVQPGIKFMDVHNVAVRSLTESLVALGIFRGRC